MKSGTIDLTKLAERGKEYLPEPAEFEALLEAKRQLCAYVDVAIEQLCVIGDCPSPFRRNRALATAFELVRELVIRDDSLLATEGVGAIRQALAWVADAVRLREQLPFAVLEAPPAEFSKGVGVLKAAQDAYSARCVSFGAHDPSPIRIWSGGSDRFLRYGRILEFSNRSVTEFFEGTTRPMYYVDGKITGIRLGEEGLYEAGRIIVPWREPSIYMEDYHCCTSELLVPDGPVIMQVVHPDDDREEYFNGDFFYIPRGVPLFIKKEIRHFAPLPVDRGVVTSPVVFRMATTTDEKDFHHHTFKYQRRVLFSV